MDKYNINKKYNELIVSEILFSITILAEAGFINLVEDPHFQILSKKTYSEFGQDVLKAMDPLYLKYSSSFQPVVSSPLAIIKSIKFVLGQVSHEFKEIRELLEDLVVVLYSCANRTTIFSRHASINN